MKDSHRHQPYLFLQKNIIINSEKSKSSLSFNNLETMIIAIFLVLLIGSFFVLIARFLYKEWWYPLSIQKMMNSQGITGPPYKFPLVNIKKNRDMEMKSDADHMELTHDIFPRLQPLFHTWNTLYGSNVLWWRGSRPQLLVTDADLIREILTNKEGSFAQHKLEGPLKDIFGDGLPFSEGQKWSKLRKVADYIFHGQSLKGMTGSMIESVEAMLKRWKAYEGKEMDAFEELQHLSPDVIARTAFGSSYSEGKDIFQMIDRLGHLSFLRWGKIKIPGIKTSEEIESEKLRKALDESIMLTIKKREDSVNTEKIESYGSDFLGALLNAHHHVDEKTRISVDDIIDECKTFYFAGNEQTATALSWTVLLLAIHTDWQQKAREEVVEQLGHDIPNTDTISRLKIMGMVINECMRLYPPTIYMLRDCVSRKTRLGEYTLPIGMVLHIPPLLLRSDTQLWGEDANLFKPERFEGGVTNLTKDQLKVFLTFGLGPRRCVGNTFAMTEMKIALSMILQRYKFTLSPNYRHSPTLLLHLQPKHGIKIMLQPL